MRHGRAFPIHPLIQGIDFLILGGDVFTASGAFTTGGVSLSATATFIPPVFADALLTIGSTVLSASATSANQPPQPQQT